MFSMVECIYGSREKLPKLYYIMNENAQNSKSTIKKILHKEKHLANFVLFNSTFFVFCVALCSDVIIES